MPPNKILGVLFCEDRILRINIFVLDRIAANMDVLQEQIL